MISCVIVACLLVILVSVDYRHHHNTFKDILEILLMFKILNALGKPQITIQTLIDFYPIKSVWSIDLSYLLKHYGVEGFFIILS